MNNLKVDPITLSVIPELELLKDIAITAAEGAIEYWANFEKYRRRESHAEACERLGFDPLQPAKVQMNDLPFPEIVITPDDNTFARVTLTPEHIRAGMQLVLAPATQLAHHAAPILQALANNDASYIDAETADVIVQLGILNSVVYG